MEKFFQKKILRLPISLWLLFVIVVVGIFFRTYHFGDWLLFKGDAFRDAVLVSHVLTDGPGSLPLLGPRAGGTTLHLGPIFYYFQSLSIFLFSSTDAPVLAYPDLLFSLLSLPLIFFLAKRYFSTCWSLTIAAMFSVSFLAIEYSRFAWNPNSVPFFTLLFLYAILRVYDDAEIRKGSWTICAGVALGVASQLHFSAFLGLPTTLTLFVLLNRIVFKKTLSWGILGLFFATLFFIYTPVFVSEGLTGGDNTAQFFKAISSKADSHGLLLNIRQDVVMYTHYFSRILTGINTGSREQYVIAFLVLISGLMANLLLYRSESDIRKRQFLSLTLIFILVYFLLYIPLSFKIDRPRFFLPVLFLPYLYVGYIFTSLHSWGWKRVAQWGGMATVLIIILSNVQSSATRFMELKASQITATAVTPVVKPQERNFWWTWGHFKRAAETMNGLCQKDVLVFTQSKDTREYDHSVEYALKQINENRRLLIEKQYTGPGTNACYFFISRPGSKLPDYIVDVAHDESVDRGGIAVTQWYPQDAYEIYEEDVDNGARRSLETKIKKHSRLFWGDLVP